jgi:hypothetical protein
MQKGTPHLVRGVKRIPAGTTGASSVRAPLLGESWLDKTLRSSLSAVLFSVLRQLLHGSNQQRLPKAKELPLRLRTFVHNKPFHKSQLGLLFGAFGSSETAYPLFANNNFLTIIMTRSVFNNRWEKMQIQKWRNT